MLAESVVYLHALSGVVLAPNLYHKKWTFHLICPFFSKPSSNPSDLKNSSLSSCCWYPVMCLDKVLIYSVYHLYLELVPLSIYMWFIHIIFNFQVFPKWAIVARKGSMFQLKITSEVLAFKAESWKWNGT